MAGLSDIEGVIPIRSSGRAVVENGSILTLFISVHPLLPNYTAASILGTASANFLLGGPDQPV